MKDVWRTDTSGTIVSRHESGTVGGDTWTTQLPDNQASHLKVRKQPEQRPAQFLILAASILDVPTSYFSHQPNIEVDWLAVRRQSRFPMREQDAIKTYATDVAGLYMELAAMLYPQRDKQARLPQARQVSRFEEAEVAAEALREAWDLDNHPIDSLVRTAEDHLVIVIAWVKDGGGSVVAGSV